MFCNVNKLVTGPTFVCIVNLAVSCSLTASLMFTASLPSLSSDSETELLCSLCKISC